MADAVEASLQALVQRGHLDRERARIVLDYMVTSTDVTFVSVRANGGTLLEAGAVPADLAVPGPHGGELMGDEYVHWEQVRLQQSALPYRHRFPEFAVRGSSDDLDLGDGDQVLAVGMLAAGYHRHVAEAVARLNLLLAVGVICIGGLAAAWMLSTRTRELGARLETARLRTEHLDDLREHRPRPRTRDPQSPRSGAGPGAADRGRRRRAACRT